MHCFGRFSVFPGRFYAWRDELRQESLSTVVTPIWKDWEKAALFCMIGLDISMPSDNYVSNDEMF
jgi:hypothetical protein